MGRAKLGCKLKKYRKTIRLATVADAADIAKVYVDTWRTSYKGILPNEVLDNLTYLQQEERWRSLLSEPSSKVIYVALEEPGRVIGFSSAGPERGAAGDTSGEIYALYILQTFQGRRIGRRLIAQSARWLLDRGFSSILVWVLADNPSRQFYEALGNQSAQEKMITMGVKTC